MSQASWNAWEDLHSQCLPKFLLPPWCLLSEGERRASWGCSAGAFALEGCLCPGVNLWWSHSVMWFLTSTVPVNFLSRRTWVEAGSCWAEHPVVFCFPAHLAALHHHTAESSALPWCPGSDSVRWTLRTWGTPNSIRWKAELGGVMDRVFKGSQSLQLQSESETATWKGIWIPWKGLLNSLVSPVQKSLHKSERVHR